MLGLANLEPSKLVVVSQKEDQGKHEMTKSSNLKKGKSGKTKLKTDMLDMQLKV